MNTVTTANATSNNAVLYCRFSSENQREESIEGQRRECTAYANKKGFTIVHEYDDRAKTGTNADRPGFQQMVGDSKNGGFSYVIVWRFDRFARSRLDSLTYKNILDGNGVKVLSATEEIIDGPDGIMMEGIFDTLSEFYSAELSQKVKHGITENVLKGKTIGGKRQFGYKIVDGRYAIDEHEAPIVKEIFRLYALEGTSMAQISKTLNDRGMTRSDGSPFNHNLIEKIIVSKRYIGILRCAGTENVGAIPRIIDDDTFEKARARHESRKHIGGCYKADVEFALADRIFCTECGAPMVGVSGTSKNGKLHSYYECKGHRKGICGLKMIQKEAVEDVACKSVALAFGMDEIKNNLVKVLYSLQSKQTPELASLNSSLADTKRRIANLMKAIEEGIYTESTKNALLQLEAEQSKTEAAIQKESFNGRPFTKGEIKAALEMLSNYPCETDTQRRAFVTTFVKRVLVKADGKILVYADVFGADTKIEVIDKALTSVRIETLLLRQWQRIRTLYAYRTGFVLIAELPKKGNSAKKE